MKALDLLFFDAGGGHRSAATALKQVIERQGRPWDVRLVNLQDVLDPLDFFHRFTGIRGEDLYNHVLKKGWTLGSPEALKVMHLILRLYHSRQVQLLRKYWDHSRPDMVITVIPNFNRAIYESLQLARPGNPMVTILTDLADYPPHFWMERQEQFFVCGTEKAVEQARALGHPPERVLRTSGMILNPRFYEPLEIDRAAERKKLGLDPALPTALVLFGGQGSSAMLRIARRLQSFEGKLQLIMLCGHNQGLAAQLRELNSRVALHVEGFTREVPYFMRLADFFIGKPGPGSISEALAMKLPVIVERNAWTLPQERYNAEWVRLQGVGLVLKSFRNVAEAVDTMLQPERYAALCRAAASHQNNAVFEIPEMLEKILEL